MHCEASVWVSLSPSPRLDRAYNIRDLVCQRGETAQSITVNANELEERLK